MRDDELEWTEAEFDELGGTTFRKGVMREAIPGAFVRRGRWRTRLNARNDGRDLWQVG